ncbi:MAG TPA: amidohydrolase family protein [Pseudonocardia sp.]
MPSRDLILRGGTVFDGTGAPPVRCDVRVRDGRVVSLSTEPVADESARVIDVTGKWVLPGLIDIHTHYDAEVLLNPGLGESIRHGVTTVLMGNCSLSTVCIEADDAADLFSRVEALPWDVVHTAVKQHKSWDGPASYREAISAKPLGANVAALIGHSDLRVAAMGLGRSVDADTTPTGAELDRMREVLREALDCGFVGLSTIRNTFSKTAGTRYPARVLPSAYASWPEYRALNAVLREHGAILQCTPSLTKPAEVGLFFAQSAALRRRPLKTTLLAAADIKTNPLATKLITAATGFVNRRLKADVRWQHLPVPFELYADGLDLMVLEELGSGAAALDIRDELDRAKFLASADYRQDFKKDCAKKFGPRGWNRDPYDTEIVACPNPAVLGRSFGQVADERHIDPTDAMIDLIVEHGSAIRWRTTIANHRPEVLDRLATSPAIQLGFADSGAHLRNMAFYNAGLRFLKRIHDADNRGAPIMPLAAAVHRLTGELADWYGLDAGTVKLGGRADLTVIDPDGLDDSTAAYAEAEFADISRMVNRNDRAVAATIVNGHLVHQYGTFIDGLGDTVHAGRFLNSNAGA